ncbi:MAG: hypothetical protein E7655_05770 [Ruminococcaceae bacterium]|nr:hypothetical protein [Oscillospiraceae bacterium]
MILRNKALLLALILCFSVLLAACGGEEQKKDTAGTLTDAEQQLVLTLAAAMVDGVDAEDGQIRAFDGDTVEVTFPQEGDKLVCVTLNKNEDGAWVAEPEVSVREETTAAA